MRLSFVASLAASLLAAASPARADVRGLLQTELRLGAGYDDNLFLDARPSGQLPSQVRSDAIFDFEPRLAARLDTGRHTLALDADFLERVTPSTGDLRDLNLRLDFTGRPAGPLTLAAAALYEYYGASLYPDDTFHLGGGELGLRVVAREWLRVAALYRGDARSYPDPSRAGQLDAEHRAIVGVTLRPHRAITLDLGYNFLHVASSNALASLDRHRVGLTITARPTAWLLCAAGYAIAWQRLPDGLLDAASDGPRDDLLHAVEISVVARPRRWLELFARYALLYSSSTAPAGNYQRDQVTAGVSLLLDGERVLSAPRPAEPTVRGARVTFRFAGRAARVAVVGDWNRWDPAAQPLARVGDGKFAAEILLPPGRHEYALSVDGAVTRPPDAPAYRPDGFGGENGVIEIP